MEFIQKIKHCPSCKCNSFINHGENNINNIGLIVDGKSFITPTFCIYECTSCGLYYKNNIPNTEELINYYKKLEIEYEDVDYLFPTDKRILKLINGDNLKVLDYGCGSGRLLGNLMGDIEKFGIELNPKAIEKAKLKGIKIINELDIEKYNDFFDYVILTDVFEHLFNISDLFNKLLKVVKPNGCVIIVTGNSSSIKYKKHIAYYWYFNLYSHLQMLNEKYANWFANHYNLELSLESISHYNLTFKILIKREISNLLFKLYLNTKSSIFWNIIFLKKVKNWNYPLFSEFNKDHLILILKK